MVNQNDPFQGCNTKFMQFQNDLERDISYGSLNMYKFLKPGPARLFAELLPGRTGTKMLDSGSGMQLGTTYFFVITAYDTSGNESSWSNNVSKSIF